MTRHSPRAAPKIAQAMLIGYPSVGSVIDRKYRIESYLGVGGMGAVAKAKHEVRDAPVALKFMSPAVLRFPDATDRFINEAVASSKVDSDFVVKVFDVGTLESGQPYLVMEYLDGRDLGELLAEDGRPGIPVPRALHFGMQILRGMQAAHRAGIVHRDIKPSNCFLVRRDGDPDFLKLLDFGISRLRAKAGAGLTASNMALGTPLFMAPEQATSPRGVDLRADVFAAGTILYNLISGRLPYDLDSEEAAEIIAKLLTQEPVHLTKAAPGIDKNLAAVIHRAMSRDRDARFKDAADFATALRPWIGDKSRNILERIESCVDEAPLSYADRFEVTLDPTSAAQRASIRPSGGMEAADPHAATQYGTGEERTDTPYVVPSGKASVTGGSVQVAWQSQPKLRATLVPPKRFAVVAAAVGAFAVLGTGVAVVRMSSGHVTSEAAAGVAKPHALPLPVAPSFEPVLSPLPADALPPPAASASAKSETPAVPSTAKAAPRPVTASTPPVRPAGTPVSVPEEPRDVAPSPPPKPRHSTGPATGLPRPTLKD
ncbi:MAG: protein kinase [Polyangiaceae bacterium]